MIIVYDYRLPSSTRARLLIRTVLKWSKIRNDTSN